MKLKKCMPKLAKPRSRGQPLPSAKELVESLVRQGMLGFTTSRKFSWIEDNSIFMSGRHL